MNFIKILTLLSLLITGSVTANSLVANSKITTGALANSTLANSDLEGSDRVRSHALSQSRETIGWHLIEDGALIIDARTAQEYAGGHITGAINIPFDVAVSQFEALNISKNRSIVLYCRSGNRSGRAYQSLTKAGYNNLHNAGGLNDMLAVKQK